MPTVSPSTSPLAPLVYADPARPFVIAQLGQSLDGRIATVSGESRYINNSAALDHLHRIRAYVDAVVVGVGTVVADNPRLDVRRVPLPEGRRQPARIVIDPNARMPDDVNLLRGAGGGPVIRIGGPAPQAGERHKPGASRCRVIALKSGKEGIDPSDIVTRLFEEGFRKILIEGGAGTVSRFIDAGVVDRLHILVAPLLIGSGKPGLQLAPEPRLSKALRPPTAVTVLSDGDVLFDCDLAAARANVANGSDGSGEGSP